MHHTNPLLEGETASDVWLDNRFVAHEESSHKLQDGDLNWEVEGGDDADGTEGPSQAHGHLAVVVAGVGKATG